jgi:FAD/FMN-containing dehydrogenase
VARQFPQLPRPFAAPHAQYVLLELSSSESEQHAVGLLERAIGAALERGVIEDAVVATSVAQSAGLWQLREHIPLAQAKAGKNIKHDISLPVSRIADFIAATEPLLDKAFPGCQLVCFGHRRRQSAFQRGAAAGVSHEDFLRNQDRSTAWCTTAWWPSAARFRRNTVSAR